MLNSELVLQLDRASVRQHQEYCVQSCSAYLRKNVNMLVLDQQRFSKMDRFTGGKVGQARLVSLGV